MVLVFIRNCRSEMHHLGTIDLIQRILSTSRYPSKSLVQLCALGYSNHVWDEPNVQDCSFLLQWLGGIYNQSTIGIIVIINSNSSHQQGQGEAQDQHKIVPSIRYAIF